VGCGVVALSAERKPLGVGTRDWGDNYESGTAQAESVGLPHYTFGASNAFRLPKNNACVVG